ncbi:MAG: cysteine desulfurase [Lachnospiraceae bacterium]|nr:cysteine desulfurase [Lachnospiraceae bacterium]MDE6625712.1 cysteine desulfurase [Lachnospiraceae bacterium]
MEVYFDNAATTKIIPEVRDIMLETMDSEYGNPSSMHLKGVGAEKYIRYARETISRQLKCEAKEIIFTSGGTEANNLALIGIALANRRSGNHIITTGIEHASVYNTVLYLQDLGFTVTFLSVDRTGKVDLNNLKEALDEDTILVSAMAVNNEMGAVEPIEAMGEIIGKYNREHNRNVIFHVDAVQAFGKQMIYPKRIGIDALSISGHKIHGPKGSGALFVDQQVKIKPILYGGGQEKGMRSGTENTAAVAGIGRAAEVMYGRLEENCRKISEVKKVLLKGLADLEDVVDHSGDAPHIANLSFCGVRSEVLLHALEDRGIYVSAGSACSSNHQVVNGVLKAMGLDKDLQESALRFSFCEYNTIEEAEYTTAVLKELLPALRRFTRK